MGGWVSQLWWAGDPDKVNPVSGLTRREVYAVQKSWAPVNKNSVATGTELLKSLVFQQYGSQFSEPIKAVLYMNDRIQSDSIVNDISVVNKSKCDTISGFIDSWFICHSYFLILTEIFFRAYPNAREFFKMIAKLSEDEYSDNFQFKAHVINLMASLNQAVTNLNQPEVVAVMMNKLGESHRRRKIQEQHFHDLKEVIVKMFIEVLELDDSTLGAWGKTVDFWYKHIFETLNSVESR